MSDEFADAMKDVMQEGVKNAEISLVAVVVSQAQLSKQVERLRKALLALSREQMVSPQKEPLEKLKNVKAKVTLTHQKLKKINARLEKIRRLVRRSNLE